MNLCLLFMTHSLSAAQIEVFEKIRQDVGKSCDCFLLIDGEHEQWNEYSYDRTVRFTRSDLKPYGLSGASVKFGDTELPVLFFSTMYPKYDYLWVVEYDVRYTEDWSNVFIHQSFDADLLTAHIRFYESNPEWNWWHTLKNIRDQESTPGVLLRSFNPVYRISKKAIGVYVEHLAKGWRGHFEVALPTLLFNSGLQLEDMGGDGPFVRPGNRNRFYTGQVEYPCGSVTGTLRFRPEWSAEEVRSSTGQLFHPVKQLHPFDIVNDAIIENDEDFRTRVDGELEGRVVVRSPEFRLRDAENGYVLLDSTGSERLVLNDVAAQIWALLDNDVTLAEIAAELQCVCHADPFRVMKDVAWVADRFLEAAVATQIPGDTENAPAKLSLNPTHIDVVVINRAEDEDRMSRAARQLEMADLSYRREEAVDSNAISEAVLRSELTGEGYAIYRRCMGKTRRGSMSPGALGCALSWRSVLQAHGPTASNHLLVLEDDFVLCSDFRRKYSSFLRNLPVNYDIIYLSWNPHRWCNAVPIDGYLDRLFGRIHGTGGLLVNPKCIPTLMEVFPLTLQLDHDLPDKLIARNRIRAFKGYCERSRLLVNDNLGGTKTQL